MIYLINERVGNYTARIYLGPLKLHLLAQLLQLVLLHFAPPDANHHRRLDALIADAAVPSGQLKVVRGALGDFVHDLFDHIADGLLHIGMDQRILDHGMLVGGPCGRCDVERLNVGAQ